MARYTEATPLSFAHLSELESPPLALVDLAARAGFASIGLRTAPSVPGGIAYPLASAGERSTLRRSLADSGVSVLYVEMVSITRETVAADHRSMLEIGAEIGATRLAVAGSDPDFAVVAERMAALCELARPLGIAVDIEFMPFRPVASLDDALDVVRRTGQPNAHVLVDALHFFRSGSGIPTLSRTEPGLIGTFQLCDAPLLAPTTPEALAIEARTHRLLPGAGGLPLHDLVAGLPADVPLGLELPIASQYPSLGPVARATLMVQSTRGWLAPPRQPET